MSRTLASAGLYVAVSRVGHTPALAPTYLPTLTPSWWVIFELLSSMAIGMHVSPSLIDANMINESKLSVFSLNVFYLMYEPLIGVGLIVCSGVPYTDGQAWTEGMGFETAKSWHPW